MTAQHPHAAVIDRLGGTNKVASLCRVKPPSVSAWRIYGIPEARLMFLQAVYPQAFVGPEGTGEAESESDGDAKPNHTNEPTAKEISDA